MGTCGTFDAELTRLSVDNTRRIMPPPRANEHFEVSIKPYAVGELPSSSLSYSLETSGARIIIRDSPARRGLPSCR